MNEIKNDVLVIDTDSWKKDLPTISKKIEIFTLVPETHPELKFKLPEFDFANPPVNPAEFASSLVETCKKYGGIGLSANQCGYEHRVFVMGANDNFVAFFNPEITWSSKQTIKIEEGCLSFPDLFLAVERPAEIEVAYLDYMGQKKTAKFSGLTARCFQHELDHMNGVLYTHRVKPLSLQMALKKKKKTQHSKQK